LLRPVLANPLQDETDPIETTFELNDTLYAKANIPPTEEVYIWLGVRKLHNHVPLAEFG
jgi:hypothetical protein